MTVATKLSAWWIGRSRATLLAVSALLLIGATVMGVTPARAQVWTELGEAGNLPASAQVTVGNGPLTTIQGTLPIDADVDMYCIRITDRANFTAALNCLIMLQPDLYLFDSSGKGVALAQVCSAGLKRITNAFVPSTGQYYLAVAWHGALAKASGSDIWLAGQTSERAPDGPGAANAVTSWGGSPVAQITFSNYTLSLSGVSYCAPLVTPVLPRSWGHLKSIYR